MAIAKFTNLLTFVCFIYWTAPPVAGFANGPHPSTCLTMFPKHGQDLTWQASGTCPFKIKLSSDTYRPLQNITVTLESDDSQVFRGIQISAHRKSLNKEEFQGTFLSYTPEAKLQSFNCMGARHSQIAHKNNDTVTKVVLVWQAPGVNVGDIVFKATFVQNFTTFWAWETKDLRTLDESSVVLPSRMLEDPKQEMDDIDFSRCGSDKGCFFYPRLCSGTDCNAAVTYQRNGDSYTFEMMAKSSGYVSLGFSSDTIMGDDVTVTCTARDNSVTVQNGYNPAYYNERLMSYDLTDLSVKKTTTTVMCRFTRPRVLSLQRTNPLTDPPQVNTLNFDMETQSYITLAWGHLPVGTDVVGKHKESPTMSDAMVDFQSYRIYKLSSLAKEYKAHGALMIIAWMLLAGLATVIARHYKDLYGEHMFCGTKIWFQLHRAIAVGILALTVASFIIIFVKVDKLSEGTGRTHAIIGITVGVAVCLQVLGGLLRPGIDSSIRPFFTWGHRLLGQGAHILSAVNFILAFNMNYIPETLRQYGTIVVAVWIAVQIVWELVFEFWTCRKKDVSGSGNITDPKGLSIQEKTRQPSKVNVMMLALYVLTLVVFAVAALCGIFIL
ncbi:putative ferric-chelate reductase 1 homolog [Haliotis rufescens]|uniref:putative ferric-chelate reductase 1 homolog n=1 Tax=Haliotis rufescens TaxID=6454 RepID=UPI00201F7AB3|nr:putative ferric-chelate reductase 1 homolog [Haliotis rufescens]